ncbi:hypothetical protein WN55_04080 [Dufourea novaeangliae]|uniref:Uncharacterized protein n=1 Tax=Dufourea novaeangliae TaxID=178035 RepID=A0A154PKJ9_DUFNO|nr:hypothetical protein WN55_04080 [Dufourea novaeangliae]
MEFATVHAVTFLFSPISIHGTRAQDSVSRGDPVPVQNKKIGEIFCVAYY